MHVIFQNEIGRIDLGGGSHPNLKIKEITGLGLPDKNYNIVTYAGIDGQQTLSETVAPRTITISGDILGHLQNETTRIAKILHHPGMLYIHSNNKHRRILCRCTALSINERKGQVVQCFVMQFTADMPYFLDIENQTVPVYERENHIFGTFAFSPDFVFTTRLQSKAIINEGDAKTEPTFYVHHTAGTGSTSSEYGYAVMIENVTTNQSIKLNYFTTVGEIVTIDIKNRAITSNLLDEQGNSKNLIHSITETTFLSDFWLASGVNHIQIVNQNIGAEITVNCEFSGNYIEAVI